MPGRLIGIGIVAVFTAVVVYMAAQQFGTECEVCMEFKGRTVCEVALASSRDEAQMQAVSSACSQLSSGVNDIVACTGSLPRSMRCSE